MNYITPEQIKEYVSKNPTGIAGNSKELSEMVNHFAELIVAECITRIEGCEVIERPDYPNEEFIEGYNKGVSKVASQVKLHFGVEE